MNKNKTKSTVHNAPLPPEDREKLLKLLKTRFERNMGRHKGVKWTSVQEKLDAHPDKLWSLNEMELSEGEPDVVRFDKKDGNYVIYDCSPESQKGRRRICYDRAALAARKAERKSVREGTSVAVREDVGGTSV